MGKRGPAPEPTALKRLKGNPGKRKLNSREPQYPPEDPRSASWLKAAAKDEWDRLAPILRAQGLLAVTDRRALEAYCQAYARWRQAEEMLDKVPTLVGKSSSGYLYPVPWVSIAQRQMELMLKLAQEFGFTPASRSRTTMPVDGVPDAADPDDDFFAQGSAGGKHQPDQSGAFDA